MTQPAPRPATVARRLQKEYPDAECSLPHTNNFQLLVAVMLSAQCTDVRVCMVLPDLFAKASDAKEMAKLTFAEIKKLISSVGLTNSKAKNIKKTSEILVQQHDGEVPNNIEDLIKLPGVGRKTANVVLGVAFGIPSLVVDTHVTRICNLLGLTHSRNAEVIEKEISANLPKKYWTKWAHVMIYHGRAVCVARRPNCRVCVLKDICPSANV